MRLSEGVDLFIKRRFDQQPENLSGINSYTSYNLIVNNEADNQKARVDTYQVFSVF
jgi:hypothetical protein